MIHLREQWEGVSLSQDYTLERCLGGDDSAAFFETSLAPDGDGSTGETDTETGALEEPHPATVSATTSSANTTRVLIETP